MDPQTLENITKAQQCAGLLVSDLTQASHRAVRNDPVLTIIVHALLKKLPRFTVNWLNWRRLANE